ncbi:MAG: DnaB-like helicase C-terminal domain-containing protein [Candidatus Rokuibacteriota bacterium]
MPPDETNVTEVIIGKQRNGPVGTVKVVFLPQYARFENIGPPPPAPAVLTSEGAWTAHEAEGGSGRPLQTFPFARGATTVRRQAGARTTGYARAREHRGTRGGVGSRSVHRARAPASASPRAPASRLRGGGPRGGEGEDHPDLRAARSCQASSREPRQRVGRSKTRPHHPQKFHRLLAKYDIDPAEFRSVTNESHAGDS